MKATCDPTDSDFMYDYLNEYSESSVWYKTSIFVVTKEKGLLKLHFILLGNINIYLVAEMN
jgi:hypothetical protein